MARRDGSQKATDKSWVTAKKLKHVFPEGSTSNTYEEVEKTVHRQGETFTEHYRTLEHQLTESEKQRKKLEDKLKVSATSAQIKPERSNVTAQDQAKFGKGAIVKDPKVEGELLAIDALPVPMPIGKRVRGTDGKMHTVLPSPELVDQRLAQNAQALRPLIRSVNPGDDEDTINYKAAREALVRATRHNPGLDYSAVTVSTPGGGAALDAGGLTERAFGKKVYSMASSEAEQWKKDNLVGNIQNVGKTGPNAYKPPTAHMTPAKKKMVGHTPEYRPPKSPGSSRTDESRDIS